MKKKFCTILAGAVVATVFAIAGILVSSGDALKNAIAEGVTHTHSGGCKINHYTEVAPTLKTYGVKEYWICCDDPTHKVEFSAPTVGTITDKTHSDFTIDETDERYIAPYTFPEVFKTKYAYRDGSVTVTSAGEIVSSAGNIYIKGSILKEAYSLGYTHMRFHAKADSADAVQICGTQDSWKTYYKRYANDNDNRYWLKSFSDANQGLKLDSQNSGGSSVSTSLTLSDFHLYKSSVTESWSTGSMTNWGNTEACHTYIAYEDGELVADNVGGSKYTSAVEIPESLMGADKSAYHPKGVGRAFYVKQLASGYLEGAHTLDRVVVGNEDNSVVGYNFKKTSDGTEKKTADGFIMPVLGGYASEFGLYSDKYHAGALSIGFDYPSAVAIRINYDFAVSYASSSVTSYSTVPLANAADGSMRLSIDNLTTTSACQLNVLMPKSTSYTGIKLKVISTAEPTADFHLMDYSTKANIWWPFAGTLTPTADGTYEASISNLTFNTNNPGCAIIVRYAAALTNAKVTFEYSWIA